MNHKEEYGDYQTPEQFTKVVCEFLFYKKKVRPSCVIEPTCGRGNFLKSSLIFNASQYYGIEINEKYCDICRRYFDSRYVKIINSDIFNFDFTHLVGEDILIVGNPPWVTNTELSKLNSANVPNKINFKKLKGIDAITGASNFDICETIILRLIQSFKFSNTHIALLCKNSVARNIFCEVKKGKIGFTDFEMFEFDSKKIFGINASCCLLYIKLSPKSISSSCGVYNLDSPNKLKSSLDLIDGRIIPTLTNNIDNFDGSCCFEWRQGIKHDCSKIMELNFQDHKLINGKGEIVLIEKDLVYPLVKSSMFKSPIINSFSKYVIVTQKKIKEDTSYIEKIYPLTWKYLDDNNSFFNKRKSSIYKRSPKFSMFGVGGYSYSRYKVGISGFYKTPLFSLLVSNTKPVMIDDTSYFLSFSTYNDAYTSMLFLNSRRVQGFLKSISFQDNKRPYSKKVLARLDFKKIVEKISFSELQETEKYLNLDPFITKELVQEFKKLVFSCTRD